LPNSFNAHQSLSPSIFLPHHCIVLSLLTISARCRFVTKDDTLILIFAINRANIAKWGFLSLLAQRLVGKG